MGSPAVMVSQPRKSTGSMRKTNKPLVERKRRARINGCLGQLKSLILTAMKTEGTQVSRLEKADILEMTVNYLRHVQRQQSPNSSSNANANAPTTTPQPEIIAKFSAGYSECAAEVIRYMDSVTGVSDDVRTRLESHLVGRLHGSMADASEVKVNVKQEYPHKVNAAAVSVNTANSSNTASITYDVKPLMNQNTHNSHNHRLVEHVDNVESFPHPHPHPPIDEMSLHYQTAVELAKMASTVVAAKNNECDVTTNSNGCDISQICQNSLKSSPHDVDMTATTAVAASAAHGTLTACSHTNIPGEHQNLTNIREPSKDSPSSSESLTLTTETIPRHSSIARSAPAPNYTPTNFSVSCGGRPMNNNSNICNTSNCNSSSSSRSSSNINTCNSNSSSRSSSPAWSECGSNNSSIPVSWMPPTHPLPRGRHQYQTAATTPHHHSQVEFGSGGGDPNTTMSRNNNVAYNLSQNSGVQYNLSHAYSMAPTPPDTPPSNNFSDDNDDNDVDLSNINHSNVSRSINNTIGPDTKHVITPLHASNRPVFDDNCVVMNASNPSYTRIDDVIKKASINPSSIRLDDVIREASINPSSTRLDDVIRKVAHPSTSIIIDDADMKLVPNEISISDKTFFNTNVRGDDVRSNLSIRTSSSLGLNYRRTYDWHAYQQPLHIHIPESPTHSTTPSPPPFIPSHSIQPQLFHNQLNSAMQSSRHNDNAALPTILYGASGNDVEMTNCARRPVTPATGFSAQVAQATDDDDSLAHTHSAHGPNTCNLENNCSNSDEGRPPSFTQSTRARQASEHVPNGRQSRQSRQSYFQGHQYSHSLSSPPQSLPAPLMRVEKLEATAHSSPPPTASDQGLDYNNNDLVEDGNYINTHYSNTHYSNSNYSNSYRRLISSHHPVSNDRDRDPSSTTSGFSSSVRRLNFDDREGQNSYLNHNNHNPASRSRSSSSSSRSSSTDNAVHFERSNSQFKPVLHDDGDIDIDTVGLPVATPGRQRVERSQGELELGEGHDESESRPIENDNENHDEDNGSIDYDRSTISVSDFRSRSPLSNNRNGHQHYINHQLSSSSLPYPTPRHYHQRQPHQNHHHHHPPHPTHHPPHHHQPSVALVNQQFQSPHVQCDQLELRFQRYNNVNYTNYGEDRASRPSLSSISSISQLQNRIVVMQDGHKRHYSYSSSSSSSSSSSPPPPPCSSPPSTTDRPPLGPLPQDGIGKGSSYQQPGAANHRYNYNYNYSQYNRAVGHNRQNLGHNLGHRGMNGPTTYLPRDISRQNTSNASPLSSPTLERVMAGQGSELEVSARPLCTDDARPAEDRSRSRSAQWRKEVLKGKDGVRGQNFGNLAMPCRVPQGQGTPLGRATTRSRLDGEESAQTPRMTSEIPEERVWRPW